MNEVLITSSVLIAVLLLARWLFRGRVSHRLIYAAWLLVALRLLIPVQIGQWQYSFASLTDKIEAFAPVSQVLDAPVAGPTQQELYDQLLEQYLQENPPATSDPDAPKMISPVIQEQLEQQAREQITMPTLSEVLCAIWIVGICGMAAWFLTANLLFALRAKKDADPLPGCDSKVPVMVSPNVPTPCLAGFFRPVIYLTPACAEDEQIRRHVLTHELTHLRHGDHIWSLLRCICLCVYWFHPLVWIAAAQSRRDCELACDEGALKQLSDDERIAYGKTLLDTVAQSMSPVYLLQTPTAMNETKRQLKERVQFIAKKRKNWLIAAICLVLIAAITTGCAFLGSKSGASVITHGASGREGYRYVYLVKEVTVYFSDGSPNTRTTYTYDEKGRVAVRDHVNYLSDTFNQKTTYYREYEDLVTRIHHEDPTEQYDTTFSYEFNDDGTIASFRRTAFGTSYTNYAFEYDALGRLSVTTLTFSSHRGEQNCYCFYDADGRLYKFSHPYSSTGEVTTLTYDDQGRLTGLRCASPLVTNVDYVYDENGNLAAKQAVDWTDPSLIYTYTDGVLTGIEYVIDPRCSTLKPKTYTLDEFGNAIRIATEDGKCTEYTYERMELPEEDARRILLRHPINDGEDVSIEAYRENFLEYYVS